jgi:hypothetical protein
MQEHLRSPKMFWNRCGLQGMSISGWLTHSVPEATTESPHTLEEARAAMLEALGEAGGHRREILQLRIRKVADARSLWELRPALMQAVASIHGEWEGRRRLARVTEKFEGLVPHARASRHRGGPFAAAR